MRTHAFTRSLGALAAAGLLVVGLAACGDDDSDSSGGDDAAATTTTVESGGSDEITVTATDNQYDRTAVTVEAGSEVYLQNDGSNPHTITADEDSGATFDTGNVTPGSEGEFDAPTEPGTYAFHCNVHPNAMKGTLTVS